MSLKVRLDTRARVRGRGRGRARARVRVRPWPAGMVAANESPSCYGAESVFRSRRANSPN